MKRSLFLTAFFCTLLITDISAQDTRTRTISQESLISQQKAEVKNIQYLFFRYTSAVEDGDGENIKVTRDVLVEAMQAEADQTVSLSNKSNDPEIAKRSKKQLEIIKKVNADSFLSAGIESNKSLVDGFVDLMESELPSSSKN